MILESLSNLQRSNLKECLEKHKEIRHNPEEILSSSRNSDRNPEGTLKRLKEILENLYEIHQNPKGNPPECQGTPLRLQRNQCQI